MRRAPAEAVGAVALLIRWAEEVIGTLVAAAEEVEALVVALLIRWLRLAYTSGRRPCVSLSLLRVQLLFPLRVGVFLVVVRVGIGNDRRSVMRPPLVVPCR